MTLAVYINRSIKFIRFCFESGSHLHQMRRHLTFLQHFADILSQNKRKKNSGNQRVLIICNRDGQLFLESLKDWYILVMEGINIFGYRKYENIVDKYRYISISLDIKSINTKTKTSMNTEIEW